MLETCNKYSPYFFWYLEYSPYFFGTWERLEILKLVATDAIVICSSAIGCIALTFGTHV